MHKRQNKINTVMKEYKSGTLKSGGSGKKVTNPKQAIAIALSEARNMNQGGMMYRPELYDRPMFQTPEQRAAGGIMGGIAPINLANGSGPEPGPWGFAKEIGSSLWDQAMEGVEAPNVSDDFWSNEKTEEGSGINARDLTDLFIVDQNDPIDLAIAAATATLFSFGITSPLAIVTQLARMGYKGKKALAAAKKAGNLLEAGQSGTKVGLGKQWQSARLIPELPELSEIPGELQESYTTYQSQFDGTPSPQGSTAAEEMAVIDKQIAELENEPQGGITNLPWVAKGDEFESEQIESEEIEEPRTIAEAKRQGKDYFLNKEGEKLAAVTKEELEESGYDSLREYLNARNRGEFAQGGIVYLGGGGEATKKIIIEPLKKALERVAKGASDKVKEIEKVNKDFKAGKLTEEQAQRRIDKIDKQKVTQDLKPTPPKESKPKKVEDTPPPKERGALDAALLAPVLGAKDIGAAAGRPLWELTKRNPYVIGGAGLAGLGYGGAKLGAKLFGGEDEIPPEAAPAAAPTAPDTPDLPPPEDPSMWERFDSLFDSPRNRAGFINMAKPTHGFAKRSPFVDFYEGAQDYDVREDEAETRRLSRIPALQQNFEFLRDKFPPGTSDKEIMDLLLKTSSGLDTKEDFLTLYFSNMTKAGITPENKDMTIASDLHDHITKLLKAPTIEMEEKET